MNDGFKMKLVCMNKRKELDMKALSIANTIITTKQQAVNLIKKLNQYFEDNINIEMALAVDNYTEQIVNAGFLTWEEAEEAAF